MAIKPLAADEFHEAIWDDEAFASLCVRLAEVYRARSTLIQWHYEDGSADILSHSGYFTNEQLNRYATEFAHLDPWAAAAASVGQNNVALDLEELVSVPNFLQSQFYNDYVRDMGDDTCRCIGIRIANDWGCGIVALQHGRSSAQFASDAIRGLDRDSVHLRRILSVRGKIAKLKRSKTTLEALSDHMTQAVLLVRPNGCLLYTNAAGERLLKHSRAMALCCGRLEFRGMQSVQVRSAISRAADRTAPSMSSLLYEQPDALPLVVTVLPLATGGGARNVLLLVQELMPRLTGFEPRLQALFGLTPAEALIAGMIADGCTLGAIARNRHVSLETIRAQLRSITSKLHCNRQAEVAAIVRSIVPLPQIRSKDT